MTATPPPAPDRAQNSLIKPLDLFFYINVKYVRLLPSFLKHKLRTYILCLCMYLNLYISLNKYCLNQAYVPAYNYIHCFQLLNISFSAITAIKYIHHEAEQRNYIRKSIKVAIDMYTT